MAWVGDVKIGGEQDSEKAKIQVAGSEGRGHGKGGKRVKVNNISEVNEWGNG